jgi:hypothetical protein
VTQNKANDWLAAVATTFSLVACYGTLAAIAVLGALGVTIALNEAVWAGAIVLLPLWRLSLCFSAGVSIAITSPWCSRVLGYC